MNLFEFKLLSPEQQAELLYTDGVYIGKRKTTSGTAVLYQLDSFYAEIFYKKYRRFIDHISCGESTSILNPYLGQINVDALIAIFHN